MADRITLEERLLQAQKRKNRAIAAENRAREQLRKAENRTKYELGGLALKAGLGGYDFTTVFGMLCFAGANARAHAAGKEVEEYFHRLGQAAWERFELEKDRKLLKELSDEERASLLGELFELLRALPFPGVVNAGNASQRQAQPQAQKQAADVAAKQPARRVLAASSGHAGFDEEA